MLIEAISSISNHHHHHHYHVSDCLPILVIFAVFNIKVPDFKNKCLSSTSTFKFHQHHGSTEKVLAFKKDHYSVNHILSSDWTSQSSFLWRRWWQIFHRLGRGWQWRWQWRLWWKFFPFLQLWFVNSFKASAAMRPDYKRVNKNYLSWLFFILRLKSRCGLVLPPSMTDGGPSGERRSKKLRERIMQKLPQNWFHKITLADKK